MGIYIAVLPEPATDCGGGGGGAVGGGAGGAVGRGGAGVSGGGGRLTLGGVILATIENIVSLSASCIALIVKRTYRPNPSTI